MCENPEVGKSIVELEYSASGLRAGESMGKHRVLWLVW